MQNIEILNVFFWGGVLVKLEIKKGLKSLKKNKIIKIENNEKSSSSSQKDGT